MHTRLHMGQLDKSSIQAQGYRGGVNFQGEGAGEGKLLILWGNSAGIILKGSHGEAACQKCTPYEGGGNWGGGGPVTYVVSFPQVLNTAR